jgi:hypothetical protein
MVRQGVSTQDSEEYVRYMEKLQKGEADAPVEWGDEFTSEQKELAEAIARRYKIDLRVLKDLFAAGLGPEEIIAQFGGS